MNPVVNHRPGHSKTRGPHFFVRKMRSRLPRKFLDNQVKPGEILAGESLPEHDVQLPVFLCKQRKIAFCAAHVARKYHRPSPKPLH